MVCRFPSSPVISSWHSRAVSVPYWTEYAGLTGDDLWAKLVQELPQLESDYGKVGMEKVITTVGNVVSGSARAKETLEWLSNDIFGKVVQLKKGVTIDRDKTSINLNENMDSLVPASKISDMPTGWICGQSARDFIKTVNDNAIIYQIVRVSVPILFGTTIM